MTSGDVSKRTGRTIETTTSGCRTRILTLTLGVLAAGCATTTPKDTTMPNAANAALANPWRDLWNGDLALTNTIIAADFVAHAAPLTGSGADQIHGRAALDNWVSGIHSIIADLMFTIEVGPITDADHLVVRWRARGTYRGGFPGAPAASVGRKVNFTGTDTLRVAGGKLAEYWANADSLLFFQQLGIRELPAIQ